MWETWRERPWASQSESSGTSDQLLVWSHPTVGEMSYTATVLRSRLLITIFYRRSDSSCCKWSHNINLLKKTQRKHLLPMLSFLFYCIFKWVYDEIRKLRASPCEKRGMEVISAEMWESQKNWHNNFKPLSVNKPPCLILVYWWGWCWRPLFPKVSHLRCP